MKRNVILFLIAILLPPLLLTSYQTQLEEEHIVMGWNDLGMHCSNKDFDSIVILPPYNNFRAQVIKVGNENQNPEIINSGLTITYEIPGNTYSVGKTNFWDYEYDIFGVELPDNIGLTGAGLTGSMAAGSDHYWIDGVPITPYTDDDLENEDPYQLALLEVYDQNNVMLASTQNVMPVSNEIGCVSSGCHSSQYDILDEHSDDMGFDPTDLPILCANCHADVALGMPGVEGVKSLSYVIHEKHKSKTNDCYKCHPGENTECFRGVMHDGGMNCADCHGDMEEVSESISEGRRPWLDEPSCGTTNCHGSNYAEEPGKLFKDSKGHGGLYCSACHGSTHAIVPSTEARDNVQNIALQGYSGTLGNCITCHGFVPDGEGPHGMLGTQPSTETAHWPMDEGSGTTTEDITVNDNDGTLIGGTSWTTGIDGNGLQFDGIDDRVDCGTGSALDIGTGDFSVSTWVKMTTTQKPYPTILGKGAGASYDPGYWLSIRSGKLRFSMADGNRRKNLYSGPVIITDNQWHHIAVVVDRDADVIFYLDGNQVGNADISILDGTNIISAKSLTVGSWMTSSRHLFKGVMDDLRLFDNALSASEVTELATVDQEPNNPPVVQIAASVNPETLYMPDSVLAQVSAIDPDGQSLTYSWTKLSGPGNVNFTPNNSTSANISLGSFSKEGDYSLRVNIYDNEDTVSSDVNIVVIDTTGILLADAHWPLEEGSGTTTEDITGNENDGTLLGGTSWTSGIDGYGLHLDGIDDRIDCGTGNQLDMGSDDFSISTWVKMAASQHAHPTFVGKGAGAAYDPGYRLSSRYGKLRLSIADGAIRKNFYSGSLTITDSQWHHVVVVVDRDADVLFYVDGDQVGSADVTVFEDENIVSAKSLTVGSWMTSSNSYLKGDIDDLRLFNSALSLTDINTLYDLYSSNKRISFDLDSSDETNLSIYPNPVNQIANIGFKLSQSKQTVLKVYNTSGQEITKLFDGVANSDEQYEFEFNASGLPVGIYVVLMQSGNDIVLLKKLIISR